MTDDENKPNEVAHIKAVDHLLIIDEESNEILVNIRGNNKDEDAR